MKAERLEVNMKHHNNGSQETRISLLEHSITNISETLIRIEKRFDRMDEKFTLLEDKIDKKFLYLEDKMDKKFEFTDSKIERLRDKMDATTKWLVGIGISVLFSAASVGFSMYQILHKM